MVRILTLYLIFISASASAGSLYSFDRNLIVINALNHIQQRYSDLAKIQLSPNPVQPSFNKSKELVVSVFFSYKADNEFGILYACAKVDEDGNLLNVRRNINARKGIANFLIPENSVCWGKP